MGTSANFAALTHKIVAASAAIPVAVALQVAKSAEIVRAAVATASGRYASSPLARTSTTLSGAGSTTVALVQMTSRKAHLLDHDTKPHDILPRRASVLVIPGIGVRAAAHSPGTKGKYMWEEGVALASPLVLPAMTEGVLSALAQVFG